MCIYNSRVVNVLRHWVDFHFYDFQRDQELLTRFQTFISTVKGKKMQKWVAALSRAVEKVATFLYDWCMKEMWEYHTVCNIIFHHDVYCVSFEVT